MSPDPSDPSSPGEAGPPLAKQLTTHVLDTARGRPAAGIPITVEVDDGGWQLVAKGTTNDDGRIGAWDSSASFRRGVYQITFQLSDYWTAIGVRGFYPLAAIVFEVTAPSEHHHVPLLLNPFGYSTYRGS